MSFCGAMAQVAAALCFVGVPAHLAVAFCFLGATAHVAAAFCFVGATACVAAAFSGTALVVAGCDDATAWPLVGLGLLSKYTTDGEACACGLVVSSSVTLVRMAAGRALSQSYA